MKIAFEIAKFFPYGGVQLDMLRMAKACVDRGHEVVVFTSVWEGEVPEWLTVEIVKPKSYSNHQWVLELGQRVEEIVKERGDFAGIIGFNRTVGLDVFFSGDNCYAALRAKRSWLYRVFSARYKALKRLEKEVFGRGKNTVSMIIAGKQYKDYKKYYHTPDHRLAMLPPGIQDCCRYPGDAAAAAIRTRFRAENGINDGEFALTLLAANMWLKGADRLVKAAALLPEDLKNKVKIFLAGESPSKRLNKLIRSLELENRVFYLGENGKVDEILLGMDLMVHPSKEDATGTVLLEAIAMHLPVIATEICGFSGYVRESGGKVINEPFSEENLRDAIVEALREDNLAEMRRRVAAYDGKVDFYSRADKAAGLIEQVCLEKAAREAPCCRIESCNGNWWANLLCNYAARLNTPARYRYERIASCERVALDEFFAEKWKDADPFQQAESLAGELFRKVKSRRTFRFVMDDRSFFAKIHLGVGWREIFKNLFQLKWPVLGADNEFKAINLIKSLGGYTMTACAFGIKKCNPARRESFLITAELKNMPSLEEYCREWAAHPPDYREKMALTIKLAKALRLMHENGINHRDCYLCHFLYDKSGSGKLFVIDLHRAQIRDEVPFRYLVKDVGGIYFSSLDAGLSQKDYFRFMRVYSRSGLREIFAARARFWKKVKRVGEKLYAKEAINPKG